MCSRAREAFTIYDLRACSQTDHPEPFMTREEMKARTKAYANTIYDLRFAIYARAANPTTLNPL